MGGWEATGSTAVEAMPMKTAAEEGAQVTFTNTFATKVTAKRFTRADLLNGHDDELPGWHIDKARDMG